MKENYFPKTREEFYDSICNNVKERLILHLGRDWIDFREFILTSNVFHSYEFPYPFSRIPFSKLELVQVKEHLMAYKDKWMCFGPDELERLENEMFYMTIESCSNIWGG